MSYFTETFESILEFKGDTDARDLRDKMSGSHKYGKAISKLTKNEKRSEDVRNMRDKMHHDNMERVTKRSLSGNRDDIPGKAASMVKDASAGKYGSYGKRVAKESFDPVYEDLCRMGVID